MMKLPSQIPKKNLDELQEFAFMSPPGGCFVELGVYKGGSAQQLYLISEPQKRTLHLYDTFQGMPFKDADIDGFNIGAFGDVDLPFMMAQMPNAKFHQGVFPATFKDDIGPISFAHVDPDQYRSVRDAIACFFPLMLPGAKMMFDDWGFAGVKKAVFEVFSAEQVKFTPKTKMAFIEKEG